MPCLLDALERSADEAVAFSWADRPVAALGDDAVQMQRIANKVDAAFTQVLGAFDASGVYRLKGHPSVSTYLGAHTHVERGPVKRRAGLARKLRTMPETAAALGTGALSLAHAYALARVNTPKVADAFAADEAYLVTSANRLDYDTWVRGLRAWRDTADPDGAEQRAKKGDERREAHASRTFDGLVRLDAWLDAIGGTEFLAEVHRLERVLFDADWAEARARLGDKATKNDLRRTAAQRRADALVEMARRSATTDTPGLAPKWVLNVMMDWATFCAETGRATGDPGPDPRFPFDPNQPPPTADPEPRAGAGDDRDPASRPAPHAPPENRSAHDPGAAPDPERTPAPDAGPDDAPVTNPTAGSAPEPGPGAGHEAQPEPMAGAEPQPDPGHQPYGSPRPRPETMAHPNAPRDGQRFCELEDFTPIAPSQALSLGLRGAVRGVIFGPKGNVLHHGRRQRLFPTAVRDAIRLRDRVCRGPGCGVPGSECEIDHVIRWEDLGPTDEWNGQLYCDSHQTIKEADLRRERQPQRA